MSEHVADLGTLTVARALAGRGAALEVLAVAEVFDDALAADLLEQFAGTNGTTEPVLATLKSLPFVLRVEGRSWAIQSAARDALVSSLREHRETAFQHVSDYLTSHFAARAEELSGRASREARWRAAVQSLAVDSARAVDHLELLVDQVHGFNRRVDLDATARLAESDATLAEKHPADVAYFVGRRAYAQRDYRRAEQEFRRVWDGCDRRSMRAIAAHLLANILLDRGGNHAETERFARESLELHREVRTAHEVAFVEVTLARVLLHDELDPPMEARGLLDDAIERLERARDDRGIAMALVNRTRYFLYTRNLAAARDDARVAVELSRTVGDKRSLINALNSHATVLIRTGGRREFTQASQAIAEADRLGRVLGDSRFEAVVLNTRSLLAEAEGRIDKAIEFVEDALELNQELGRRSDAERNRQRLRRLRAVRAQSDRRTRKRRR